MTVPEWFAKVAKWIVAAVAVLTGALAIFFTARRIVRVGNSVFGIARITT